MCALQSAVQDATELHDSKMEDMEIELKAANERIAELKDVIARTNFGT